MSLTPDAVVSNDFRWRRVLRLFAPHKRRVLVIVAVVLLVSTVGIINPLLIQVIFDTALFGPGGVDLSRVVWLALAMLATIVVGGWLGVVQTIMTNRLGQEVLEDLRNRLYAHLQQLSITFYTTSRTGDLQARITSDVGGIQTAVTSTAAVVLSNSITFLSAVVAMAVLSWQLTAVSLATVPLFVLATTWVGRRRERHTDAAQAATAEMSVITQETLSVAGITLARLFGRQDRELERFEGANERLARAATAQQVIGQAFFTVIGAFLAALPVLAYLVSGLLLDRGTGGLTAGTIVAVTTLQSRLFFPVARLLETMVELQSSRAMFRRVFAYFDVEPEVAEAPAAVVLDADGLRGELTFDAVSFAYPSDPDRDALESITFAAGPGQLVAFVGPSGSGKSTVLSLAARLYDVTSGVVRIDGIDVRDLSRGSLAELMGFVTQESYLFAGTLRANLTYGAPDATDDEIENACRTAQIHNRIVDLPDGYDTVVGERGARLSGGERQRVAIARVLLHDPRLLVLDEATSALDTASERSIQTALGELISSRTTLAVAHRLSTIQAADAIHVIEDGRIVESGDHDALLRRGQVYSRLYREQFGEGLIETTCADGVVLANGLCEPHQFADSASRRAMLRDRAMHATGAGR